MKNFTLVVHGGAGRLNRDGLSAAAQRRIRQGLAQALRLGGDILEAGGTAVDAVTASVVALEEHPSFNAGRGAVLNRNGVVEMDASIMDGCDRRAGAVAAVSSVRNPIRLARAVMEETAHVLLAQDGAHALAEALGHELAPPQHFITDSRRQQWQALQGGQSVALDHDAMGTVGAVACDQHGHLAAATSTGGMTNKLPGRVGDSALIGAGTWAWDRTCAVSATGHGERFIRSACAARLSDLVELAGLPLGAAADRLVNDELLALEARGGLIAVDGDGNWSMPFNDGGMLRGVRTANQPIRVGIWDELTIWQT